MATGIVLEALRKDNYDNWSALVKNYLVGEGLWRGIVEAANPNTNNKPDLEKVDEEWRWRNAKALHTIQLACGSENLSNIRRFEKAREAWNHLKVSFSDEVGAVPDIEQGRDSNYVYRLHRDVKRGYWNDAKSLLSHSPDALFSTAPSSGWTVLHVAVASGQERIVKNLTTIGNQRLVRMQDKRGYTALALAAELTDNTSMAKTMVAKGGKELLTIKTKVDDNDEKGEIPVLLAATKGHKNMIKYLFSQTPIDVLFDKDGRYGVMLLTRCISAEIFDVAAFLLQHTRNRETPLIHKTNNLLPILHALSHLPSAFSSGTQLGWWRQFIYNSLKLQTHIEYNDKRIEIVLHVEPDKARYTNILAAYHPTVHRFLKVINDILLIKHLCRLFRQVKHVVQTILRKLPGSEEIYEMKRNHYVVLEILKCLSQRISKLDEGEVRECLAYESMLQAAKYGIIEFIDSMRRANPDLLWAVDKNKRGIFSRAILYRHEKVFQLIHEIGGRKDIFASRKDVFSNNMLHLVAELGPSSDLGSRSNAALQMQRELHWYKAVEKIVPPKCKQAKNADGKKPCELFTKNHEELVKEGEKWARDTAGSFTLVGTLIITIMFAAAFTVPGGNDQISGIPMFLKKPAFTVFILADAISLIASSSSVLSFIWILTSRYAEKDFLWSLPLKLLFGLITLFFSVASMMIAFVSALFIMLKGYRGVVIAVTSLALIPVLVLILTLLSLSYEISKSTCRYHFLASKNKTTPD